MELAFSVDGAVHCAATASVHPLPITAHFPFASTVIWARFERPATLLSQQNDDRLRSFCRQGRTKLVRCFGMMNCSPTVPSKTMHFLGKYEAKAGKLQDLTSKKL